MTAVAIGAVRRWRGWRAVVIRLLFGLALLGGVFWQECAAAVSVWSASTAYNHCFLVLPIAAFLAYERRARVAALAVRPVPWAVALALPVGVVWLVAERLGIMEGRQLAAIADVEVLALAVLGPAIARALAGPLSYVIFLVPFGAFLTGPLQDFTASFVVHGLDLFGIANFSDGHTIEIPEGVFVVAEACAGLRFLIAAVAFGALYALTLYRSPGRRLAFMAASLVVPVLANGVRAFGIVMAGHWLGSAQAASADHLVYGWIFFSVVIILLIVAGLPFRQDGTRDLPAMRAAAPAGFSAMTLAILLLPALAGAGPLLAAGLDRAAEAEPARAPAPPDGCTPSPAGVGGAEAALPAHAGAVWRAFICENGAARLVAITFPARTNPTVILSAQRSLTDQGGEDTEVRSVAGLSGWRMVMGADRASHRATALYLDGEPSPDGLRGRMLQARHSVLGATREPLLLVMSATDPGGAALERAVRALAPHLETPVRPPDGR